MPTVAHAQPAPTPPPAPAVSAADAARQDLEQQKNILKNAAATPAQKDEAAKRLVQRDTPETHAILKQLFTEPGASQQTQIALAHAMVNDPNPDPSLIQPLVNLIGDGRNLAATDAAAQALASLAHHGSEEAWARLEQQSRILSMPVGSRAAIIKSMGKLVDKRAAQTLVDFLRNEPLDITQIQNAAKAALVELTGLQRMSGDREQLIRWWDRSKNTPDAQWKEECHVRQADTASGMQNDLRMLADATRQWVQEDYNANPEPRKLEKLLGSGAPQMRLIGVDLALSDWDKTGRIAPTITAKLRDMIGDSATQVRQAVVRVLRTTLAGSDDATAKAAMVDALIAQLTLEKDSDVKAAIALALGQFRDLRAIEPLLNALNDESVRVQEAAAGAIKDIGPLVVASKNVTLVARVRDTLRSRVADAPRMSPLRTRLVEAMATLQDPSLLNDFYGLLNRAESGPVRRAAIAGLAGIGNPNSANAIMRWISDAGEAGVRLEAASALRQVGSFNDISSLIDRLNPSVEQDKSVREAVLKTILALADKGSPADLNDLANKLPNAEQRLEVLKLEEQRLAAANSPAELAACRENIAQTSMELGQPKDAARYYVMALDYWISQNTHRRALMHWCGRPWTPSSSPGSFPRP